MAMMTRPPGAASGVRLCVATPAFDDEATLPDVFFRLQRLRNATYSRTRLRPRRRSASLPTERAASQIEETVCRNDMNPSQKIESA